MIFWMDAGPEKQFQFIELAAVLNSVTYNYLKEKKLPYFCPWREKSLKWSKNGVQFLV